MRELKMDKQERHKKKHVERRGERNPSVTRESPQVSRGFRVRTTGIASTGPVSVIQNLVPSRNLCGALPHSLFSLFSKRIRSSR